jgi:hypothetical protein
MLESRFDLTKPSGKSLSRWKRFSASLVRVPIPLKFKKKNGRASSLPVQII